ncbi:ATP-binding protein [Roseateles cellulosilyticus]|uniref:ATP-binding protein n=1 Tax=Pelomonas cellulosilytica TaxID=2906762 RepID=UPI00272A7956|nr:ATP-binding protein [Pelomonas sp. P8]
MNARVEPPLLPPLPSALRPALEAVSAALLAHDGDRIVFANDAMLRLLGQPADALMLLAPEAWAEPSQQPLLRDYGRRCLASAEALPALEIDALSASGTRRSLEITARRMDVGDDLPPLVLLTCQDLSDIRHVQNSLMEVGRVMQQIVENGPVASYVLDRNHRVTHWNAACAQLTGLTAQQMVGRDQPWRAFHAEARPMLAELIVEGCVEDAGPLHYGAALQRSPLLPDSYAFEAFFPALGKDGRWLYVTAAPLRGMDGQVMGAIETLQDISQRRRAEEQLRRHQAELESIVAQRTAELLLTHHELEAFLENAPVGIVATRELQVVRSNKKFAEILELPLDVPPSSLPPRQFFQDEADFVDLGRMAVNAMRSGTSLVHETWLRTWTGRRIWVQLIAYVSDTGDGPPGMWWLLQDQSEVMRAQEELVNNYRNIKETNARLEEAQNQLLQSEKMASIGQLAAGVAHEINNPIGFVNSNLGTLRRYVEQLLALTQAYTARERPPLDAELAALKQAADLEFIAEDLPALLAESEDGLSRVRKIVQDLKDFSRVDHADWQDADLNAGLESTLNVVMNEVKYRADVQRCYGTLLPVRCLAGQLNQVFMNLIVNAVHAMPAERRGVITLTTGMRTQDDGDWVWVEVADNGCGMSAEVQRRIFEPFFTTKPVGQGTGLGLSLSFSIVQKHGGRIEVESAPGEGTTFRIWVPVTGPDPC